MGLLLKPARRALALVAFAATVASAVPATIAYQAELADDSGVPLEGALTIDFTIFDAVSGGNAVWTETHAVSATNGLIHVELGSVGPSALDGTVFDGTTRYLEIVVDGGDPLTPRTPLLSVPYAIRSDEASHALTADTATEADSAGVAGSASLADFATLAGHAATADSLVGGGGGGGDCDKPWFAAGDLGDLHGDGEIAGFPVLAYEYGITYAPTFPQPVPIVQLNWNQGQIITNLHPTMMNINNPELMDQSWGGFMFYIDTAAGDDDACTATAWRHKYWRFDYANGETPFEDIGGNGCRATTIYARKR